MVCGFPGDKGDGWVSVPEKGSDDDGSQEDEGEWEDDECAEEGPVPVKVGIEGEEEEGGNEIVAEEGGDGPKRDENERIDMEEVSELTFSANDPGIDISYSGASTIRHACTSPSGVRQKAKTSPLSLFAIVA